MDILISIIYLACFVALIVGIVQLIIAAVKKKPKKRASILTIVSLILCMVLSPIVPDSDSDNAQEEQITTTSSSSSEEQDSEPEATQTPSPAPTVSPEPEESSEPENSEANEGSSESSNLNLSMDEVGPLVEAVVSQNFDNYDVDYDDSGITINIWEDGIAAGATMAAYGDETMQESWNELSDNMEGLCSSVSDSIEAFGIEGIPVMINVVNDANHDNVLLSVLNGVVIYDAVQDVQSQ